MFNFELVVAYSQNRVMGRDNQLPWHLPDDLRHFKQHTINKTMLMGRKTYESIGKPLPKRQNIILTRQKNFKAPGCEVIHDLSELNDLTLMSTVIAVAGGAEIYQLVLPYALTVYATEILAQVEGDTFFPELPQGWVEHEREHHPEDARHDMPFDFVIYRSSRKALLT